MFKVLLALKEADSTIQALLQDHQTDVIEHDENPLEHLRKNSYHLALLEETVASIPEIKALDPRIEIILFGDKERDAVELIKEGAAAYFSRPVDYPQIKEAIHRIHDLVEMRRETAELEKLLTEKYTFSGIVAKNPQMLEVFTLVRRIAPYYRTVLISGETGTGKEVLARAIHNVSPWANNPFIVCNCGSLVEGLIESELFGHLKGSFTGAIKDKIGLFESAGEGTLFLDEIGELPLSFQAHLLRVLQNGDFRRVGSNTTSKARCRIITATNRDLDEEVRGGRFREDLFFRITPITVKLPRLCDRKDDLLLLSRFILDQFKKRTGKKVFGISRPAQATLMSYDWPGNVRELENVLERAAIFTTESFIRLSDLPTSILKTTGQIFQAMTLEEVEKNHIQNVLGQNQGNRTRAAEVLGISRRALIRKIQKLAL